MSFVFLQIQLFFATIYMVLKSYFNQEKVLVINNTMLSMGSILATKLCLATNIVYLHEWTIGSQRVGRTVRFLSNFLIRIMADEVVFVSEFLSDRFKIHKIHNKNHCSPQWFESRFYTEAKIRPTAKIQPRQSFVCWIFKEK